MLFKMHGNLVVPANKDDAHEFCADDTIDYTDHVLERKDGKRLMQMQSKATGRVWYVSGFLKDNGNAAH